MNSKVTAPALTDARGMGGVIAQDGFDYQLWDGLARLPGWLTNPAFEQIIFEGLEDLEARFFAPHAPRERLLERYQAKAGSLTPAEVREVLETFLQFEASFSRATRVHTLVTPRLPQSVSWLGRDPSRVRRARPFYSPFADIMAASDEQLRKRLINTYGDQLGLFIADSVEMCERNLPDRDAALATFALELDRAFPLLEAPSRRVAATFEALSELARRSIGSPLDRASLVPTIEEALGEPLLQSSNFPVHILSDRNDRNERSIEIDASQFSGAGGEFPVSDRWTIELLEPLDRTARWLRSQSISRIALSGSYRLTTALAVGWSLRAAIGFELDVITRSGTWATDDRPSASEPSQAWRVDQPTSLYGDQLVVCVGVLRDPAAEIIHSSGVPPEKVLRVFIDQPTPSASAAQAGVMVVKRTVDEALARLSPEGIQLYFAGPAALAVALGHGWNAMPPTRLHEFISSRREYVATALL